MARPGGRHLTPFPVSLADTLPVTLHCLCISSLKVLAPSGAGVGCAQFDWESRPVPSGEAEAGDLLLGGHPELPLRRALLRWAEGGVGKAGGGSLFKTTFKSPHFTAGSLGLRVSRVSWVPSGEDFSLDFIHCALLHLRAPQVEFSRTLMPSSAQAARLNGPGFVSSSTSDRLRLPLHRLPSPGPLSSIKWG